MDSLSPSFKMAHYILAIDKIPCSEFIGDSLARLRFDVSSCIQTSDPNNNVHSTRVRNIACFDILEDGVKSIRVSPIDPDTFEVEFIKGCDPDPNQTASVQIIHKRHGILADSHENVALFQAIKQSSNGADKYPPLTTFKSTLEDTITSEPKDEPIPIELKETRSKPIPILTEEDIQNFSQFTFKFHPAIPKNTEHDHAEYLPEVSKTSEGHRDTPRTSEVAFSGQAQIVTAASPNISTGNLDIHEPSKIAADSHGIKPMSASESTILLQWLFDDAVTVTIELHNLMYEKQQLRSTQGLQNIAGYTDINYNTTQFGFQPKSPQRNSRLKDLKNIAQATLQKKEDILMNQVVDHFPATSRALIVRRFIKDMIAQRLLSLGVQHLDCNEIIDAWQSNQIQSNYYTSPFFDDYQPLSSISTDPYSPNISKPNSSLFRLTPSGHISRSIFSTFARQVETLKNIICNATCTLIHSSIQLLLPEIKLLKSRQLETNSNPHFISEWIRLIILAANGLDAACPQKVSVMVDREMDFLKSLSKDVYLTAKKVDRKIQKLCNFSEDIFHKSIHRINPKSMSKLNACTQAMKNHRARNVLHFNADHLKKISIQTKDLLKEHVFLSETPNGELLFKNNLDSAWTSFDNLEFANRRLLFLAMAEDLQMNLKSSLNTIQHLQEIYTIGYPTSIRTLLKDVITELESTSKREDLTVLIKTSLVTHISCLHELLSRLQFVSREMCEISKTFYKNLKAISFNPSKVLKDTTKRKFFKKVKFLPQVADALNNNYIVSTGIELVTNGSPPQVLTPPVTKSGIEHSNAQLVIPLRLGDFQILFQEEEQQSEQTHAEDCHRI